MQADKIGAWFLEQSEDRYWEVELKNESEFPVSKIILTTINGRRDDSDGRISPPELRVFINHLMPGTWYTKLEGHRGMHFLPAIEMAFTDWNGKHWIKTGNGKLSPLHLNPTAYYLISEPISWEEPLKTRA